MPRDGSGAHTWPAGSTATSGATIESAKYNGVLSDASSEITASLPRSGVAAMTGPLDMGSNKITDLDAATLRTDAAQLVQVQNGSILYAGTASGTDTYTASLTPASLALVAGQTVRAIFTNANTGAATFNLNALGATSIVKDVSTALAAGDISAGELCELVYDGTNWVLQDVDNTVTATTTVAGVSELATAAEYRNDTAGAKALTPEFVWDAAAEVTLTDAATIAVDLDTGINFVVTLTANRTLGAPTNEKVGQSGYIRVVQDVGGTNTLAFSTDYEFAGGSAPTLTTTGSAEDMLFYTVIATNRILITSVLDIS
jgi:hypothetical protein